MAHAIADCIPSRGRIGSPSFVRKSRCAIVLACAQASWRLRNRLFGAARGGPRSTISACAHTRQNRQKPRTQDANACRTSTWARSGSNARAKRVPGGPAEERAIREQWAEGVVSLARESALLSPQRGGTNRTAGTSAGISWLGDQAQAARQQCRALHLEIDTADVRAALPAYWRCRTRDRRTPPRMPQAVPSDPQPRSEQARVLRTPAWQAPVPQP